MRLKLCTYLTSDQIVSQFSDTDDVETLRIHNFWQLHHKLVIFYYHFFNQTLDDTKIVDIPDLEWTPSMTCWRGHHRLVMIFFLLLSLQPNIRWSWNCGHTWLRMNSLHDLLTRAAQWRDVPSRKVKIRRRMCKYSP